MAHEWAKALAVLALVTGLLVPVLQVSPWKEDTPKQEDVGAIAQDLLGPQLFPFELLSVLLLAALVGALYMGQKLTREEKEP